MSAIDPEPVLHGERLAVTRALTQIENNTQKGYQLLEMLFPYTGKAHLIGVTGAPGTGKSTLVNQLAYHYRHHLEARDPPKVAVIAVDPTSPFSGGALLGDRVRMQDLTGDPGVFVRSMASRGSLGGLAGATGNLVQVFDAAGFEIIIIETVGAGQAEVDIASLAHSTIVVEAPGLGDEIQTIKAGILEIADILAVNKADKPGADHTLRALRTMLTLAQPQPEDLDHHGPAMKPGQTDIDEPEKAWVPPVLPITATTGEGIPDLVGELANHASYLKTSGEWKQREQKRLTNELEMLLRDTLRSHWETKISPNTYQDTLDQVINRKITPWKAVELLMGGANL
mgnify:CR=1 FL=1